MIFTLAKMVLQMVAGFCVGMILAVVGVAIICAAYLYIEKGEREKIKKNLDEMTKRKK